MHSNNNLQPWAIKGCHDNNKNKSNNNNINNVSVITVLRCISKYHLKKHYTTSLQDILWQMKYHLHHHRHHHHRHHHRRDEAFHNLTESNGRVSLTQSLHEHQPNLKTNGGVIVMLLEYKRNVWLGNNSDDDDGDDDVDDDNLFTGHGWLFITFRPTSGSPKIETPPKNSKRNTSLSSSCFLPSVYAWP